MCSQKKAKRQGLPEQRTVHPLKSSAGGFNLIEVMLALLIMSIVLIGTSMMHVKGRQFVVNQTYYQQAAQLASQELENLRAISYDDIVAGVTTATVTVGENSYQKQTTIALTDKVKKDLPKPCYKATVTITWTLAKIQHQASFATYIGP